MLRNFKSMSCTAVVIATFALAAWGQSQPTPPAKPGSIVERMHSESAALLQQTTSMLGKAFLSGSANLPSVEPPHRTIYRDKQTRMWLTASQRDELLKNQPQAEFEELIVDERRYYDTKYGSPIAYARLFDLLGSALERSGRRDFAGMKLLDFGYGTIGHLRMLASQGADVTGLDVDSFLTALYSAPTDTGAIQAAATGVPDGRITLVSGRFNDPAITEQVGKGYDVIISKNTLKRGYINPPSEAKADPRMLIDLGVDHESFLRTLHEALNPGGYVAIYNICGKQNDWQSGAADQPYLPMADGLCPFEPELLKKIGFEPVVLDQDDTQAVREMAKALRWDQGPNGMNLQDDLFAWYTLIRKAAN